MRRGSGMENKESDGRATGRQVDQEKRVERLDGEKEAEERRKWEQRRKEKRGK